MSGPRSTFIGHGRILAHAHLRCPGVPPVGRSPSGTDAGGGVFKGRRQISAGRGDEAGHEGTFPPRRLHIFAMAGAGGRCPLKTEPKRGVAHVTGDAWAGAGCRAGGPGARARRPVRRAGYACGPPISRAGSPATATAAGQAGWVRVRAASQPGRVAPPPPPVTRAGCGCGPPCPPCGGGGGRPARGCRRPRWSTSGAGARGRCPGTRSGSRRRRIRAGRRGPRGR